MRARKVPRLGIRGAANGANSDACAPISRARKWPTRFVASRAILNGPLPKTSPTVLAVKNFRDRSVSLFLGRLATDFSETAQGGLGSARFGQQDPNVDVVRRRHVPRLGDVQSSHAVLEVGDVALGALQAPGDLDLRLGPTELSHDVPLPVLFQPTRHELGKRPFAGLSRVREAFIGDHPLTIAPRPTISEIQIHMPVCLRDLRKYLKSEYSGGPAKV